MDATRALPADAPSPVPGERTVGEMAGAYEERLRGDAPVASTGLAGLDAALGGGLRRRLLILGGCPGSGKTALAHQVADAVAAQGVPVAYYTLETPAEHLYAASVCRASGGAIARDALLGGPEDATIDPRLEAARNVYLRGAGRHLTIAEGPRCADDVIEALAAARGTSGAVPVVFVDYLQLMALGGYGDVSDERAKIKRTIRVLREAVDAYGAPVVALSSINRDKYSDASVLSALEGTAALEYAADAIIILDYAGEKPAERRRNALKTIKPMTITFVKNRYGPCQVIGVTYLTDRATFAETR